MDPDSILSNIRDNLREWNDAQRRRDYGGEDMFARDVTSDVEDLIEWLDNGGFLPQAWQNKA